MQPSHDKRSATRIKCAHCGRPQRLRYPRCRCCGSRLPLWYLLAALFLTVTIFLLAAILSALFGHAGGSGVMAA